MAFALEIASAFFTLTPGGARPSPGRERVRSENHGTRNEYMPRIFLGSPDSLLPVGEGMGMRAA